MTLTTYLRTLHIGILFIEWQVNLAIASWAWGRGKVNLLVPDSWQSLQYTTLWISLPRSVKFLAEYPSNPSCSINLGASGVLQVQQLADNPFSPAFGGHLYVKYASHRQRQNGAHVGYGTPWHRKILPRV